MTYRATRSLLDVRAARACFLTSRSYRPQHPARDVGRTMSLVSAHSAQESTFGVRSIRLDERRESRECFPPAGFVVGGRQPGR